MRSSASDTPASWLVAAFAKRKTANRSYSLRAFARSLGVSPGALSDLMNGHRPLSVKMAIRFVGALGLEGDERRAFLAIAKPVRARRRVDVESPAYVELPEDTFRRIADPVHYALLGLLKTDDVQSDLRWMAKRLRAPASVIRDALGRLERAGLVAHAKESGWRRTTPRVATTTDIPSAALRASHRATLEDAIAALDGVPVELRDITSMTVALDPARLPEAKALMREFRRRFLILMENGPKREVYNLNMQLVPVTHPINGD